MNSGSTSLNTDRTENDKEFNERQIETQRKTIQSNNIPQSIVTDAAQTSTKSKWDDDDDDEASVDSAQQNEIQPKS